MKYKKIFLTALMVLPLLTAVFYSTFNNYASDKYLITMVLNVFALIICTALTYWGYKSITVPQQTRWHLYLLIIFAIMAALPLYRVLSSYREWHALLFALIYLMVFFFNVGEFLKQVHIKSKTIN